MEATSTSRDEDCKAGRLPGLLSADGVGHGLRVSEEKCSTLIWCCLLLHTCRLWLSLGDERGDHIDWCYEAKVASLRIWCLHGGGWRWIGSVAGLSASDVVNRAFVAGCVIQRIVYPSTQTRLIRILCLSDCICSVLIESGSILIAHSFHPPFVQTLLAVSLVSVAVASVAVIVFQAFLYAPLIDLTCRTHFSLLCCAMSSSEEYPVDGAGEAGNNYLASPSAAAPSSGTDLSPTKPQSSNGHDAYDDGERARDRERDRDRDRDYRDEPPAADASSSSSSRTRPPASSSGAPHSRGGGGGGGGGGGYRQSARKLYVGNLPPGATQQDVMDLFARSPVPCALPSQVDMKLGYAFVVSNE